MRGERRLRRGLARLAAGGAFVAGAATLSVGLPQPASAAAPTVTATLSPSIGSIDWTHKTVFVGQIVHYTITMQNSGPAVTDEIAIHDYVPLIDASFVTGSASCGSTPGCTPQPQSGTTLEFDLAGLAASTTVSMSFDLQASFSARGIFEQLGWNTVNSQGVACSNTHCRGRATVYNQILEPPIQLSSSPRSGSSVSVGQKIVYTVSVLAYAYSNGLADVTVTDPVPAGSAYVDGSASCGSTAGCTASESGGVVTFGLTQASFAGGGKLALTFSTTVDQGASGLITDVATWAGGACVASSSCTAYPHVSLDVAGSGPSTAGGSGGGGNGSGGGGNGSGGSSVVPTAVHTASPTTGASPGTLASTGVGRGLTMLAVAGVLVAGAALAMLLLARPAGQRAIRRWVLLGRAGPGYH